MIPLPCARRTAVGAALAVVALVLGACADGAVAPVELLEYQRARARWQATRPIDYSYVTSISCFCPVELNQPARVEIRGDTVAAVRTLSGTLLPRNQWYGRTPIDSLFQRVLDAGREAYVDRVLVSYDATYGYPTRIEIIPKPGIADGESITYASDLRPLPVP